MPTPSESPLSMRGVKQSGAGLDGSLQGMDDYVVIKCLCIGDVLK